MVGGGVSDNKADLVIREDIAGYWRRRSCRRRVACFGDST